MDIGTRYGKAAFIITPKWEPLGKRIVEELKHGATLFHGEGVYTGKERPMLIAAVPSQEIRALERIVHDLDPRAFMMVLEAYQVIGEGFVPIDNVVENG